MNDTVRYKINELASLYGIVIKELDLTNEEPDALIIKNYIGIKKGISLELWNYLVLHEMGHYFLHMDRSSMWNNTIVKDKYELEADAFACRKILEFMDITGKVNTTLLNSGVPLDVIKNFLSAEN